MNFLRRNFNKNMCLKERPKDNECWIYIIKIFILNWVTFAIKLYGHNYIYKVQFDFVGF